MIYAAVLGLGVGVALELLFNLGAAWAAGLVLSSAVLLIFVRQVPGFLFVSAAVAACALGVARTDLFEQGERARTLVPYTGSAAVVEGRVVNDPEPREQSVHAYVAVSTVNGKSARGMLLALLPRETEVFYNDMVVLRGRLEEPEVFATDTGRVFDYPGYLRVRGISATMPFAALLDAEPGGPSLRGTLYTLKHLFMGSLERTVAEPQAALAGGIILGERRALPEALTDAFIISGLIHVVVLSGYNISIVSESVLRFFGLFLPRTVALGAGAVGIVLFALMAGAGAATVRACAMGLIAVVARYLRRPSLAMRALALAAAGMVLWNPPALLFDPGFILSVLATFGLIALSPWVERRLTRITPRFGLRAIAASTIAVQLYVLPALLYMTGILSLVSFPANIIALPVVPLVMLLGFVAGLLGWLHPLVALLPALGADLLLRFIIAVAEVSAALPLGWLVVPAFPLWLVLAVYVPLTLVALRVYRTAPQAPAN